MSAHEAIRGLVPSLEEQQPTTTKNEFQAIDDILADFRIEIRR